MIVSLYPPGMTENCASDMVLLTATYRTVGTGVTHISTYDISISGGFVASTTTDKTTW